MPLGGEGINAVGLEPTRSLVLGERASATALTSNVARVAPVPNPPTSEASRARDLLHEAVRIGLPSVSISHAHPPAARGGGVQSRQRLFAASTNAGTSVMPNMGRKNGGVFR